MIQKLKYKLKNIAILLGVAMLFFNCEIKNKEELGVKEVDFPSRTVKNAHLFQKSEGKLIVELEAPIIEEYGFLDSVYTVFEEGIDLKYYSKTKPELPPGSLHADWATLRDKVGLYHAEGNVVMITQKGDTIKTNSIFWDSKRRQIYTKDTVVILRANHDVLNATAGLEANESFTKYTLFRNKNGLFHLDSTSL